MRLFKKKKKEKSCCNIQFEEIKETDNKTAEHSKQEVKSTCDTDKGSHCK